MKKKNILFVLLAILVVIQFFQIDKTNPESEPAHDFIAIENPPEHLAKMLKDACYDCHSNEVKYPWYTNVQPIAWWIKGHIRNGCGELNYSEWKDYNDADKPTALREMADKIEKRHMPPKSYRWMHTEAKFSDEQITELVAYFREKAK